MWKNRIKTSVLYFALSIPIIWLVTGVVLYLMGNVNINDWRAVFVLRDYPVLSVVLLLVLCLLYWMSANHHWEKILKWFSGFKLLSRVAQATILLSATFYISLFVTALLFYRLTGYAFQSDWTLLLIATVPLLALIILFLIEKATSVKAKFAGVEIEFQRTITEPINQTVTLEQDGITKGFTSDLHRIVQGIQDTGSSPHSLIVRIGRRNQMRIQFVALREYVYELSKVAPIEYIVFIDENVEYLGYMLVERFKAKYPKFGIELMVQDFQRDEGQISDAGLSRVWRTIFRQAPLPDIRVALDEISHELVLPQWDIQRDYQHISELDLSRLGASRLYLQNPTGYQAYQQMIENKVSGIPVIDDRRKFLGVATMEKVMQEVIKQLLEKGQKAG